jgi:hypothetical protein
MASIEDIMNKLKDNSNSIGAKMKVRSESLRIQRRMDDIENQLESYIADEINYIANGLNYGPCATNNDTQISDEDKGKLMQILKSSTEEAVKNLPSKVNDIFKDMDMGSDSDEEKPEVKEVEVEVKPENAPATAEVVKNIASSFGY